MLNIHTCSACGFKWQRGKNGDHSCTSLLKRRLKSTLEFENEVIVALKAAYLKHQYGNNSIGTEELGTLLLDTLCNMIGTEECNEWIEKIDCEYIGLDEL